MERLPMRNDGENIIIKMSSPEMAEQVMRMYDHASLLESMKNVNVSQEEIDQFADEINASAHQERQKRKLAQ